MLGVECQCEATGVEWHLATAATRGLWGQQGSEAKADDVARDGPRGERSTGVRQLPFPSAGENRERLFAVGVGRWVENGTASRCSGRE